MIHSEKSSIGATVLSSSDLPKPSYPSAILEKPSMESIGSSYAMSTNDQIPASHEEYDPTLDEETSSAYEESGIEKIAKKLRRAIKAFGHRDEKVGRKLFLMF